MARKTNPKKREECFILGRLPRTAHPSAEHRMKNAEWKNGDLKFQVSAARTECRALPENGMGGALGYFRFALPGLLV